jgi:hypothetical protein
MRHTQGLLRPALVALLAPLLVLAEPLEAAAPDSTAACLEQVQETVPRNKGSRFLTQEIPEASIARIEYGSRNVSPWPPIVGAVAMGTAGVVLGSAFDTDEDLADPDGISAAVAFGVGGTLIGGVFGLVLSAAMGTTTFTEISCGGTSPAP